MFSDANADPFVHLFGSADELDVVVAPNFKRVTIKNESLNFILI